MPLQPLLTADAVAALEPLTQFGVAGLMGALWVWERRMSRRRERQLSEAHDRLVGERERLAELVDLVKQNTRAIEGFELTQARLHDLLERWVEDRRQRVA